ncbi:MAG: stage V sporulation protein SpoVM [Vulcanibacillus sp.]
MKFYTIKLPKALGGLLKAVLRVNKKGTKKLEKHQ